MPDDHALPGGLPEWVCHLCSTQEEHPPGAAPGVDLHLVATLDQAREAAAQRARELGYPTTLHRAFICADAENSGRRLALELLDLPPGVSIWGGESTVRLPPEPGRGGRAQHLALAAAQVIEGSRDLCFLSAATDGSDGPGEDAGGLVDGQSIARGVREGLDPAHALAHADAGRFLESSGDLITTGPTGTNVMDLMIGLKWDLGGRDEHQGF
ncbi:MAG: MOFRL family protein [Candidatus Sedimenticola endophacoides]